MSDIEIALHEALKKLGIKHTWPLKPVLTEDGKHVIYMWNVEETND